MTVTGLQGGWWLRSPGNNDNNAAYVNGENGNVNENGNNVTAMRNRTTLLRAEQSRAEHSTG